MTSKIQKIIRIAVTASVLLIYGGEAHAFGFPMFMKTYLADAMRTWATTALTKALESKEHNNLKLLEESIERGNFVEVYILYQTVQSDEWDKFGNDPFGYVKSAAEKALRKEANEYISVQRKKGEEYLKKQLEKDAEKDKDKNKDQDQGQGQGQNQGQGSGTTADNQTGSDGTAGVSINTKDAEATRRRNEKHKAQVFNWYKNTRSLLGHTATNNGKGIIGDVTNMVGDNSKPNEQGSADNSSTDKN